jgi:hypothetical protein
MTPDLVLPEYGQFIAALEAAGDQLTVRLTPEMLLKPGATAFIIKATTVANVDGALAGLRRLSETEDYVYVYWREGDLVLEDESGFEVVVQAKVFSGGPVGLTAEELKDALRFSQRLYENAHAQGRKVEARLQHVRDLLLEQTRRLEAKGANHAPDTAAGVLYAQQLKFIERLLREIAA